MSNARNGQIKIFILANMSLAKRIIPVILHKRGQMVKGRQFKSDRVVGHALQASIIHASRSVDELMLIDVSATNEGREPDYELVKSLAEKCFSPLTIGGGINKDEHIRGLLNSGADKVLIGTAAWDLQFIKDMSQKYGSQCIAISIDVYNNTVHVNSGKTMTTQSPERYAKDCVNWGAGEIVLTSIERDGTMQGYDLDLIKRVSSSVNVPVIAAGGAGSYQHMLEAIQNGADGVAVGAAWVFRDLTPKGAATFLHNHDVEVRL